MELHLANLPPEVDVFSEMLGAEIAMLEIDVSNPCVVFQTFMQGTFLLPRDREKVWGKVTRSLTVKPRTAPE
jgi:hypothetical protein